MSDTYCIYRIVNFKNGKCYIGLTVDPKRRKYEHFCDLKRGDHHNQHLQKAYNLYGTSAFYFEILEKGIQIADIKIREQHWIRHFDSYNNGYNLTPGGDEQPDIRKTPCVWNGVAYDSVASAARACGINLATMQERLEKGYKADEDVRYYERPTIYNGISYPSIKAAAKANKVSYQCMKSRIYAGITSDKDIVGYAAISLSCEWDGIQYPSIQAASDALNVPYPTLSTWIKKGYKCDADVKGNGKSVVWNDTEYKSIREAALRLGINYSTMRSRIQNGHTSDNDLR